MNLVKIVLFIIFAFINLIEETLQGHAGAVSAYPMHFQTLGKTVSLFDATAQNNQFWYKE